MSTRASASTAASAPVSQDAPRAENLALSLAGAGAVIGVVIGLVRVHETRPLAGTGSIGEAAAYAAMVCAGAGFLAGASLLTVRQQPWLRSLRLVRRLGNLLGLAALHAVFAFLLTSVVFEVFAGAFPGVVLDRWAGPSGSQRRARSPPMWRSTPPRTTRRAPCRACSRRSSWSASSRAP